MALSTTPPSAARRDKRRAILDAASPAFGEHGYERASIDAVAAAAGVAKPTVYAYFGSKEQLFRESMADVARQVNEVSRDAVRQLDLGGQRWRESLRTLAMELTYCQRSGCAASLSSLALAEARRDPEVLVEVRRAGFEPIREALAGRLAMLGNAGHLRVPDPELAARHFLALTQAELPELTSGGTVEVSDDIVRASVDAGVDTFLRAYASPATPSSS